ncbi:MAG TPA: heme exporter protein CcmB [Pseudomonadales bacterium]
MTVPSIGHACLALLRRDLLLLLRRRMDLLNPAMFAFLVTLMFPLGLGPAPDQLSLLAPGLVWVIMVLSCLWTTDGLFDEDFRDGSLALMVLGCQPLYFLLMARLAAHWLASALVIVLLAPLLALMLNLPAAGFVALVASLAMGSVSLVAIGAIGAALTVSLNNSGLLLGAIVMPLYVPVIIFGSAAVQAAIAGQSFSGHLAILAAMLLLALVLAPLAIAAALRINLDAG